MSETRTVNIAGLLRVFVYDEMNNTLITSENISVQVLNSSTYSVFAANNTNAGNTTFTLTGTSWLLRASNNKSYIYPRTVLISLEYTASQNKSIYLPNANGTIVYDVFKLQDFTGEYKGANIQLKKNINGSLEIIHSTFFDVIDRATAYLIRDERYQITLTKVGAIERIFGLFIPTTSEEVGINTVQIPNWVNQTYLNKNVSYSTGQNGTAIIFIFNSSETTTVNWTVYNGSNKSLPLFSSVCINTDCLFSYAAANPNLTYTTKFTANGSALGNYSAYSVAVIAAPWDYRKLTLNLPADLNWYYNAFAIAILIILAGIFGGYEAKTGGVIVALAAVFFWWVGWLDLGTNRTSAVLILSLVVVMAGVNKFHGEEVEKTLIADVLGQKVTSGGFFQKLADMRAYGLITGRGKVRVTDLGKKLTYPETEDEKMQALESIIRNIPLWDAIYSKFRVSPTDSNFWIDLRQITSVEAPEAQKKAELVRKAYMDDVRYLKPVEKPVTPISGEAIGRSETMETAQVSASAIGYIGFPEYSKAPIEIKDEVSYNIAKQLLEAIGQKLKTKKAEQKEPEKK